MKSRDTKTIEEDQIPVIDMGPLRDRTEVRRVGEQLAWAASQIGFIYVENHGVADAVNETARACGLRFFQLPLEQKRQASTNQFHHGYLPSGSTKMYDGADVDLKESFNWGMELDWEALGEGETNPLLGPNVWPQPMPELKNAVYPYFESASACAIGSAAGILPPPPI